MNKALLPKACLMCMQIYTVAAEANQARDVITVTQQNHGFITGITHVITQRGSFSV